MSTSPRPGLAALRACPHGSLSTREAGEGGLGAVLDFSASCNPLGASPLVPRALAAVDPAHYPDDDCRLLRRVLAKRAGVAAENVVVGNGSVEIIWLLATAYLRPGDTALVVGPTFGEYMRAAAIAGANTVEWRAAEADGFAVHPDGVANAILEIRPRLVFLCNPNNPTGTYLRRQAVAAVLAACHHSLLVVDEAYLPFVTQSDDLVDLVGRDLVLLRSLTKDRGLAGLRLGYALAAPEVVEALLAVKAPWSVSAAAQVAGLAALADDQHVARGVAEAAAAKAYLAAELARLGLAVRPSAANFLLVHVGDGRAFREALLRRGCCLRDCTSFGLPEYVRIGMKTVADCRRLVAAVEEELHDC